MNEEFWSCPNCQTENPHEAAFCGECGTPKVKEAEPEIVIASLPVCPVCGAQCPDDAVFCGECGARMVKEPKQKVCKGCKVIYPFEKRFCLKCGEPLIEKESLFKKKRTKRDWFGIVKQMVLPLIALLFLVFSFLPIYSIDLEAVVGEDADLSVKVNAVDNIVFFLDVLHNDSYSEIEESRLYERMEDLQKEVDDIYDVTDIEDLKPSEKRTVEKVIKLMLRVSLREINEKITAKYFINALLSLLYFAFAIVFFVISLLEFFKKINNKETKNIAQKLLVFSPFATLLLFFFSKNILGAQRFGANGAMSANIVPLIVSSVAIIGMLVIRLIREKKKDFRPVIFKLIAFSLSCLILCIAFAGMIRVEITGVFYGSENKRSVQAGLDASYYLTHEMDEDTLFSEVNSVTTDKVLARLSSLIGYNSAKEIKNGEANASIYNVINSTALYIFEDVSVAFALVYYLTFLLSVCAAIFGADVMCSLLEEKKKSKALQIVFSISTMVFSVVAFILNILFIASINSQMDLFGALSRFECKLAAGNIILTVFSILMFIAVFFFKKEKRKNEIEGYTVYQG